MTAPTRFRKRPVVVEAMQQAGHLRGDLRGGIVTRPSLAGIEQRAEQRGERITPRMIEACRVLAEAPKDGWTPAAFATRLWGRDKAWARGQGPWGLGPDASGRHGGRMLNRLRLAGLATFRHEYGYYTATLTAEGEALAARLDLTDPEGDPT